MKKILLALFAVCSYCAKAQYADQTIDIYSNTGCSVYVFLYASDGSGSVCTEYYNDLRPYFSSSTPAGTIPPHTHVTFDNHYTIVGSWYYYGSLVTVPAHNTFYYTGADLQLASGCNSFSHWDVGESCTGFSTTATVSTTPYCCGSSLVWYTANPGGPATLTLNS